MRGHLLYVIVYMRHSIVDHAGAQILESTVREIGRAIAFELYFYPGAQWMHQVNTS